MKGIGDVPALCRSFLTTAPLSSVKGVPVVQWGKAEQGSPQPAQGFPAGRTAHPCAEQLCPSGAQVNNPTRTRLGASTFFLGEYGFSK